MNEVYELLKDLPNAKAGELFTLCKRELANGGDETVLVGEWCEFCEEELEKFDILNFNNGWFKKAPYFITSVGGIGVLPSSLLQDAAAIGNRFESRKEAERAREKLKAWGHLQGYGFHFTGWREDECSGDIIITAQQPLSGHTQPQLDILFGAKDD